jgi:hypothetical protein
VFSLSGIPRIRRANSFGGNRDDPEQPLARSRLQYNLNNSVIQTVARTTQIISNSLVINIRHPTNLQSL